MSGLRWTLSPAFRAQAGLLASLAGILLVGLGSRPAWAGVTFSPAFCEFAVDLPDGGRLAERRLGMAAPVTGAESLTATFPGYGMRAQCLAYQDCGLSTLGDDQKLATLREVVPQMFRARNLVVSTEATPTGTAGRAEAAATIDGIDAIVRVHVYWGECTRLMVLLITEAGGSEGIGRWLATLATVRLR